MRFIGALLGIAAAAAFGGWLMMLLIGISAAVFGHATVSYSTAFVMYLLLSIIMLRWNINT